MSSNDILISPATRIPENNTISAKIVNLLTLNDYEGVAKNRKEKLFVAIDTPVYQPYFVQVKGFYVSQDENEVAANFRDLIASTDKASIVEVAFPWHMVKRVRNLVFRAK
jgi:hypothetical protein